MRILYKLLVFLLIVLNDFFGFSQATLNLGSDLLFCSANGTATITANATGPGTNNITSYAWSINSNPVGTSTDELNVAASTTPNNPQIVSCVVTLNNNNVLYDTVQVFTTIPTISNDQCVANGGSATLVVSLSPALPAGYTATYDWAGPSSFSATSASTTVSGFNASKAGTYSVTINISNGGNQVCSTTLTTQLNLPPNTPTFNIPTSGCQGVSYTPSNFSPQSGVSYLWTTTPASNSTGLSSANPTFIFTSGGVNSVSVTATHNASGCTSTSSTSNISLPNFNVNAPFIEIDGTYFGVSPANPNTIPVCLGLNQSPAVIENNFTSESGFTNPASVTYTYSLNGSPAAPILTTVQGNISSGNNPLLITASFQGCVQSLNVNVYLGSNPFVSLGTSNSLGLCPEGALVFSMNPEPQSGQSNPPGTTYTVFYSDTPGATDVFTDLAGITSVSHIYNTSSCGSTNPGTLFPMNTFYAQVTAANFCGETVSSVSPITVNAFPTANFTVSDSTVCAGQSVTVTNTGAAGSVIGNSPPYTCTGQGKFYWTITGGVAGVDYNLTGTLGSFNTNYFSTASNGSDVLTLNFINPGYYTITQHYYNVCGTKTKVRNICVIEPPVAEINYTASSTCSPVAVNLSASAVPPTCNGTPVPLSYTWTVVSPSGTSASYTNNTGATPTELILTNTTSSPQNFTITLVVNPKEPGNPSQNFANPNCFTTISESITVNPIPVLNPVNIASCDNPYQVDEDLNAFCNIPNCSFTWFAIMNPNVTGETLLPVIGDHVDDLLENTTGGVQTVIYSITATSTLGCSSSPTNFEVALNAITAGSISDDQIICEGTAPNPLTSTAPIGGGAINYQWQQSSDNVNWTNIAAASNATFNPPALNTTTYYRRVVSFILNGVTCTATSNVVTITVNLVSPGAIASNQNLCVGNDPLPLNFTTNASGSGNLSYQWQSSNSINGPWTSIAGQTATTYDPPILNNTTNYSVLVTSTLNGLSCLVNTNVVSIQIFDLEPGVIAASQTICTGGDPTLISSASNASSTGTTLSYQWQQSTDNVTWTNISGATNTTYDPPILSITTHFRRVVHASLSGNIICTGFSNEITITLVADPIISEPTPVSQTLCTGLIPSTISVNASGGISTNYLYQWYSTPNTHIPGATSSSFAPPSVNGTYFCVVSIAPTQSGCSTTSSNATVTVVADPILTAPQSATYCQNESNVASLTINASGGISTNYSYQWFSNAANSTVGGTAISGATDVSYTPDASTAGTVYYYCEVSIEPVASTGCSSTSAIATITVIPTPVINPIADFSVCHSQTSNAFNFGGVATSYSWTNNNTATGIAAGATDVTSFDAFNATNPSISPISSIIEVTPFYIVNGVTCEGSSSSFTITVNSGSSVDPVNDQVLCHNQTSLEVNFTGNLTGVDYNWTNSNNSLGLNSNNGLNTVPSFTATNTTDNVVNTTLTVTPSTQACSGSTSSFTITVNPIPEITNTVLQQELCPGATNPVVWTSSLNASLTTTYEWTLVSAGPNISGALQNGTGTLPSMNLINSGTNAEQVVYTVTPIFADCMGNSVNYTFTINPGPEMNPIAAQQICSGSSFTAPDFSSSIQGISYSWQLNNTNIPAGISGFPQPNGNGNINGVAVQNNSDQPYTLIYAVTPNIVGLCSGAPVLFELTIQPVPSTIFSLNNQTLCSGNNSQAITLNSPTPNVEFQWNANIPASITGVIPTSGNTSDIPVFVVENTSDSPQTIVITATANVQNSVCPGISNTISITVLPIPIVNPVADFSLCNNEMSGIVPFSGNATSYNWSNNNLNTGIASSATNIQEFSSFLATNSTLEVLSSSIVVVPIYTLNGVSCEGDSDDFLVHVYPSGHVNPVPSIELCSGSTQNEIVLSTTNTLGTTTYTWTNDNSSIGLASSGNGNIPTFVVQNTTDQPITGNLVLTPTLNLNGISCVGQAENFTITINPIPVLNPIINQTVCNNQLSSAVNFSGSGFTNVSWTNSMNSIGLAASGNGNIAAFTAVNNTLDVHVASITASPLFVSQNLSCPGNSQTFTITVSPTPNVDPVSNQTVCHGQTTDAVIFSGNVQGVTYNWESSNINIGLNPSSGINALPIFSGTNLNGGIATTSITVVPSSLGCPGVPASFTIDVYPVPAIANTVLQQVICPGPSSQVDWLSTLDPTLNTEFTWTVLSAGPNISGHLTSGTGALPVMNLNNVGNSPQNITYSITPHFADCVGASINYNIVVNPGPTMNSIAPQEICSGESFTTPIFSSTVVGLSYTWSLTNNNIPATVLGFPQPSGNGNLLGSSITNTSPAAIDLIYEVIPSANGCSGTAQMFTLTVHPELQVFFTVPDQTICDGSVSSVVNLSSNAANALINWSVDSIPPGLIGLNVLSGSTNIPSYHLVNTTSQEIVVTFTVQAVDVFDNSLCPGVNYVYSLTVLPAPFINAIPNQLICNGTNTTPIQFTGTGTSYAWVSDLPNIGMAADGLNSIPSFIAQNNQSTTLIANISATPMFLLNGVNCLGSPIDFTLSVNPSGQVNPIQDVVVCNQDQVASLPFVSSNFGGTNTFSWINSNTTTGLSGGGISAFTPAFTGQNSGVLANISLVTITPTFTNLGLSCTGPQVNFSITVNPTPIIFSTSDSLICNNTPLFLGPATNVPSIFEWQGAPNSEVLGVTTNVQNGAGIDQTLNNTSNIPQIVTYTITPISSPQGCSGVPSTINVTIQPNISISSQTSFEICSGTLFDAVMTSNIPATLTWFATINPNISGASTTGNSGNIINDVLVNTSSSPQQVVYTVNPTSIDGNCPGTPLIINVLVYPELQITNPNWESICSQEQLNILLTANAPGTFSWFATPNGNVSGTTTSIQNTNVISDQLTNLSSTIQQVQYNVVITSNNQGCTSQNYPVLVEVSPTPTITSIPQTVVCHNENVFAVVPSGVFTAFNWTNSNTQNGLSASGTNATQIPAFMAQNTNNFPLTSQVLITPLFVNNGLTCQGQASTGQIVVNPTGQINPLSSLEVCNNQNVASVIFSTQNVQGITNYSWNNNNLNTGLQLTSGVGNVPAFISSNATNQPINSTISAIATYTNQGVSCASLPQSYTLTVNPVAQVNALADLNYCVGNTSPVLPFSGLSASSFSWTNSNTAIGLGNGGNGNLPSFTATNNSNNVIQGTIAVTGIFNSPVSSLTCPGNTENFTISVSPTVFVNAQPNQNICSGEFTQVVNFSSNVGTATYTWTNSNPTVGLAPTSGTNVVPSFAGINNSTNPISTTISVTGTINSCSGPAQSFQININPTPQINNALTEQTICSGQQTQGVTWQHNLTNNSAVTYNWTIQNANAAISGALNNGAGNLPSMTLVNANPTIQNIVYTVTPTSNGCVGLPFLYTIFVSPTPTMNPIPASTFCSGDFFNGAIFSSNIPGVNYQWNLSGIANIPASVAGYPTPSGLGAMPGAFITNTGNDVYTLSYVVTPSVGVCTGTPQILEVSIVPNPVINFSLANQEICSNTATNAVLISSPTNGTVLTWQVNSPAGLIGLNPTSGTSFIPEYTLSNQLIQAQNINFTVTGIVSGLGCAGDATYSITVLPIPTTQAQNTTICSEDILNTTVNSNQNATFIWSAIPNPAIGGASINNQNTAVIDDQLFNLSTTLQIQQYTAQSFLSPQGCPGDVIQINIIINPLPYADFAFSNPCDSDTIFFTNNSNPNNLFLWNFGDASSSFQFQPWHIYDQQGNYAASLQVTDAQTGCMSITQTLIKIPGQPNFIVDTTQHCAFGQFTFTNITPGSFTDVVWDFGDGSYSNEPILSNHVYANVGCYDVTLSLVSEGCPYSLTLDDMVCILPNPVANFVVPESIQSYNNNLFTFENLSQHAEFFNWDFGDGTGSNSIHPIHSYNAPSGIYGVTLVAMNEYGCADTAKFSIQLSEDLLVYVPNAFTPNGDNTNAVFKPIITEGIDIFTYRLLIFNRWGEVLFESLNKEVGWDGTYGGNVMQDGVYVWKLTFNSINDEEEYEFIGHVSLLK